MMANSALLLCTDMDGTVIPDGRHPEAPDARPAFAAFCAQPHVTLVYVTGRDRGLVQKAIAEFSLPLPDYAITDVGSMIYAVQDGAWTEWTAWNDELARDWAAMDGTGIARLFSEIPGLRLQEESKQNLHKVSFYFDAATNREHLRQTVEKQLADLNLRCNCIWSVDPVLGYGLLDLLPKGANKLLAIRFLQERLSVGQEDVVFAGDSGNDMQVFHSEIRSILVGNADEEVRQEAVEAVTQSGRSNLLYCARGFYAAGVLEGIRHYQPHERMEEGR